MKELKARLEKEINNQVNIGGRTTSKAVKHWCVRIMHEMEIEEPGRVWVQNGKLPFVFREHHMGQTFHEAHSHHEIWQAKERKKDVAREAEGSYGKVLGQFEVPCQ